jgi:predicted ATPase
MSILPHPIIERLRVKNYRSLADVDIQLGPLNVLVGQNGSGKSNVIDVLRFVRDALMRGLDTAILDRGGMSSIRRWSPKGAPVDVTIQLHLRGKDWSVGRV